MEIRLLFKFYRSYFEVASELEDNDRLLFYDSLMKRQFLGIEPELNGMSKFAYISQKHSIDKQIEGWEFKTKSSVKQQVKQPIQGDSEGGSEGGSEDSSRQEKGQEKEKEKVKEEYNINFEKLLSFINIKTNRNFKIINKSIKNKYHARLKDGYTKQDILDAISNSVKNEYHAENNNKYLTPEFFSRADTLDKYSNIKPVSQVTIKRKKL